MTSLLASREGGLATDATGELTLYLAPGALNVDTMITILREEEHPSACDGYEVLYTWRVDAYPAPIELNAKASLAHRVVEGVPGEKLRFFLQPGNPCGPIPADGWQALTAVPLGDRWLDGRVWFLPPAVSAPPKATYSYVCLVRMP